jgi:hypothetical protein
MNEQGIPPGEMKLQVFGPAGNSLNALTGQSLL